MDCENFHALVATQNLQDAGCDVQTIDKFLALEKAAQYREQLRLLAPFRTSLLQALHTCQKRLDCLDYLLYQTRASLGRCTHDEDAKKSDSSCKRKKESTL